MTCASITRIRRGRRSEVPVGPEHGLPKARVLSCDNVITVPIESLDPDSVGHLDLADRVHLDQALRYSLDIRY